VLADSPPACIRCARAAFAVETTDLLDANESTWAFAVVDRIGCDRKPLVKALAMLVGDGARRDYCGRSADAATTRRSSAEREKALSRSRRASIALRGHPPPFAPARRV
jgi:hypothetical protein